MNVVILSLATVDGSEILLTTWDVQNLVHNGIDYQPQLVGRIFSINRIIHRINMVTFQKDQMRWSETLIKI